MYTKPWHNFKRLAQRICTFFAEGASWLFCATYADQSALLTASKANAGGQPTQNNQTRNA
jgi:hypothetical protein